MTANTPTTRWIAVPGLVLAGLLAALFLHEWFTVGVVADPAVIEGYHFGSEAMVGNGGWHYATRELYTATALVEGLVALAVATAFATAAIARSVVMAMVAYAVLAVGLVANQVLM
jgi:hypothetical protein